jgi:hypothetical protein
MFSKLLEDISMVGASRITEGYDQEGHNHIVGSGLFHLSNSGDEYVAKANRDVRISPPGGRKYDVGYVRQSGKIYAIKAEVNADKWHVHVGHMSKDPTVSHSAGPASVYEHDDAKSALNQTIGLAHTGRFVKQTRHDTGN